ncbi:hypothetical protein PYCCODRAFT_1192056 [Trametes coccinea BRFM310]|uniref:Uncharacterized protein n=1 Tax=Trametes coccinea (strain BRFM310) TaxID=1353009 RepID=A0A1Y2I8X8_TRAC3|nr:hypothetical protein PYCCODRAFT_1192056 [Trametes coccinea BRFM310]
MRVSRITNGEAGLGASGDLNDRAARSAIYNKIDARHPFMLATANISPFHPLRHGSWVAVCKLGKLYLGQVMVMYTKGGGQRPTHNYATTCEDVAKLSRLVVLAYTVLAETVISPLTVSLTGGTSPDSPAYLYLHQENLLASLDSWCAHPVESTIPLQPGLSMLTVKPALTEQYNRVAAQSSLLCTAVEDLFKETRKRRKRTEKAAPTSTHAGGDGAAGISKRARA